MLPNPKEMETAFLRSDSSYDGVFFTAVRTTGIFCRPSCSARKPLPQNVQFYGTVKEALYAGYRPCLRCKPLQSASDHPEWVQTVLRKIEEDPQTRLKDYDLRQLAIDPVRLRRYFLRTFGLTFQSYCRARRMGRAFEQIRKGEELDDVVFDQGYESHSGFRDAFFKTFGTAPGHVESAERVVLNWIETPVGPMIAGANDEGICLLEFTDRRMLEAQFESLRKYFKCAMLPGTHPQLEKLKKELRLYFEGKLKDFTCKLVYPGSEFQRSVWNALQNIPYGETRSYEDLAREVNDVKAVRAVGHANGLNRICLLIPCHRVINKDGKLGGYGGGLWRKEYLLRLEKQHK